MGYNTEFQGGLKIKGSITPELLDKIDSFLGEDCRNHPEWGGNDLTWIDLERCEDTLYWDGGEKTYDLPEKIQLIMDNMRKDFPDFGLEGKMVAQGEDFDDRWILKAEGDKVHTELLTLVPDSEFKHFPNGFESWHETHYIVVEHITDYRNDVGQLTIESSEGFTGLYSYSANLTDQFEKLNEGREWDGEYYDELYNFLNKNVK